MKLLGTHHLTLPSSCNTLLQILMTIGNESGQCLQHSVFFKWTDGKFEDRKFREGWEEKQDLCIMFCHEAAWMAKEEEAVRGGATKTWLGGSFPPAARLATQS